MSKAGMEGQGMQLQFRGCRGGSCNSGVAEEATAIQGLQRRQLQFRGCRGGSQALDAAISGLLESWNDRAWLSHIRARGLTCST